MKNIVLIIALVLSASTFSQEQRKYAILPECENAEDPKLCLEQKLQKDITSFFSPSITNRFIAKAKTTFFVISVSFYSDKNGKVDPNGLSVMSSFKELNETTRRHILDLPLFLVKIDENGNRHSTHHGFNLVYKIDKTKNEIVIPTPSELEDIDVDIPFALIEDVPVFPGCENVDDELQKRKCFQQKIQRHIAEHFRYPKKAQREKISGRVAIIFIIDKEGNVTNIRTRGPHEILEKEAVRIIKALPKMIPGKHKGRPVRVPFSIPLTFKLN